MIALRAACLASLVFVPTAAWSGSGDLFWLEQYDVDGGVDTARAISPAGSRLIVVGDGPDAGVDTLVVRSWDVKNNVLRWEDKRPNPDAGKQGWLPPVVGPDRWLPAGDR